MTKYGPHNPHPLSTMRTELVWEGKYDEYGQQREVDVARLAMPLQRIETIDEPRSRAEGQGELFDEKKAHRDDFRNRLIWGDNKLVLASLLEEFKGRVDLIYIDPPFDVGADFTMDIPIGESGDMVEKDQSLIEMVAYRDIWGKGIDSYLSMIHERLVIMKELLAETGSIYVHCDWHVGHFLRHLLDDVFGKTNFRNDIVWYYYNTMHDVRKPIFPRSSDRILFYVKNREASPTFHIQREARENAVKQLVRKKVGGRMVNARDEAGNVLYRVAEDRVIDEVWRIAQLDFSATPKNDKGVVFSHVVCDTPLGEAVDAGIIKTPVIGKSKQIIEQPHDDAAYRFEAHLRIGYERWKRSREEWHKSGRKPLLFVMCENTDAADQITARLNSDAVFKELNGKTINLHINLKGKIKKQKAEGRTIEVFVEDEKAISDEDLKALRRISRDLDSNESHYTCIVSVLMLREGWDVRNVTTIVPLRPLTAQSNILPEQTLGRGLRRMTPPGQANELVTVVEHPSFINLYEQELEQEGLPITIEEVEKVPATTVTIFPDETKDFDKLDIVLPALTAAHEVQPKLEELSIEDVRAAFKPYKPLPLGKATTADIEYEGRALITDELVESMKISLPLLQNGLTAVSFFVRELESACRVQSTHTVLAPLLQTFLGEMLFGEKVELVDPRLTARLSDQDVREHIRAVFIPLIRQRTVKTEKRRVKGSPQSLRHWKPFQATFSESRPVERAAKTLFNLVPCNRSLEVATTKFLDKAPDVAAFAKNAGPQAVRIDYLTADHRLAFYTPDFFTRDAEGAYYLIETKGRQDQDVPRKASAAVEWCKTASKSGTRWQYVFVPQTVMEGLTSSRLADLVRACAPALQNLLSETTGAPELPLFGEQAREKAQAFYSEESSASSRRASARPPRTRRSSTGTLRRRATGRTSRRPSTRCSARSMRRRRR